MQCLCHFSDIIDAASVRLVPRFTCSGIGLIYKNVWICYSLEVVIKNVIMRANARLALPIAMKQILRLFLSCMMAGLSFFPPLPACSAKKVYSIFWKKFDRSATVTWTICLSFSNADTAQARARDPWCLGWHTISLRALAFIMQGKVHKQELAVTTCTEECSHSQATPLALVACFWGCDIIVSYLVYYCINLEPPWIASKSLFWWCWLINQVIIW